ncbi:transglycosylase SLT domain-containing protein [Neptuniibacter sp.]|uniref:transglycosylase SLT domain-containing protein n=1 Tax=Neptuniibacter sp. TaxID=1962643 RepID=UPI003B5C0114
MCERVYGMKPLMIIWLMVVLALLLLPAACAPVEAAVPQAAKAYQRTLTRSAHAFWGLDAPVATFAAQIHQESLWQPTAKSWVGAQGLSQFMPATAEWIVKVYPDLKTADPYNPGWSIRAMLRYDKWLLSRIKADTECDRWAMAMAAYNGGLGWLLRDKKLAAAKGQSRWLWWNHVERFNTGRSAANFKENRGYPRRILLKHEPKYRREGWGLGVCGERYQL